MKTIIDRIKDYLQTPNKKKPISTKRRSNKKYKPIQEFTLKGLINKNRSKQFNTEVDILANLIVKHSGGNGAFTYKLANKSFKLCNHNSLSKSLERLWKREMLKTDYINKKKKSNEKV
tara:strand:- start:3416 stop:3769 length:354 start_codon:yes stop_codon:yes gene_type:complete